MTMRGNPDEPRAQGSAIAPFLVCETGDLYSFDTVDAAERALEAVDVKDGIYRAFDATGRLLRLEVRVERRKLFSIFPTPLERVVVSLAEETPSHQEELADILRKFLVAAGEKTDLVHAMTFDELVHKASGVSKTLRRASVRRHGY